MQADMIAHQYEVKTRIYYIDRLGKFDYGSAHASSYAYVCQQKWVVLCVSCPYITS